MATIEDSQVAHLLAEPNHAVVSTLNEDGTVHSTVVWVDDGADEHIDRLATKYLGVDEYPYRTDTEQRISYLVDADRVRHQKQ